MLHSVRVVAVIPAAGSGRRMNTNTNKIWLPIDGQSVVSHTLKIFLTSGLVDHVVLIINPAEMRIFQKFVAEFTITSTGISLVAGGEERQDSVANALHFLKNWPGWTANEPRLVAIHDAARALLTFKLLTKAIQAGWQYGAVGIGVPMKDTIKQVNSEGFISATLDRLTLWAIQTPQVFDFDLIWSCYQQVSVLPRKFSDDCSIAEYCGYRVKLIEGSYENLKITTPEDLVIAETILRSRQDMKEDS